LDPEEEQFLILFDRILDTKEKLNIKSVINLDINNKLIPEIKKEFYEKKTKKKIDELKIKCHCHLYQASNTGNIDLLFDNDLHMDYFLKGLYLISKKTLVENNNMIK
jgi:hypothetical protein